MNNREICQENEIDLRDLFLTLMKNWKIIFFTTLIILVASFAYVTFKNPIPIYSGSVMLEIGEAKSDQSCQIYFDKNQDLKALIENQFNITVNIPKKTKTILTLISNNSDKKQIESTLKNVVDYVIQRHKEKAKLYDKYIMTEQIGNIIIKDKPINLPKKKLIVIVSFITGFILSIFLVFFLEFIRSIKEDEGH